MQFNGQVALVTGASRGIGAAIAETLAQAGAKVIGTATTADGNLAISNNGQRLVFMKLDELKPIWQGGLVEYY